MVTSVNSRFRSRALSRLRGRLPLGLSGLIAGAGCGVALTRAPNVVRLQSEAGLLDVLGAAADCAATRASFEPSLGALHDLALGRGVFFECREAGKPRDIYRARVRISPEGALLAASCIKNLTNTREADETSLATSGAKTAYLSRSTTLSVTLFERRSEPVSLEGSLRSLVENGTLFGYRKTHFHFSDELGSLEFRVKNSSIAIKTTEPLTESVWDLETLASPGPDPLIRATREPTPSTPLLHLSADLLRSVVGADAVAQLEHWAFQARDLAHRTLYHSTHGKGEPPPLPPPPQAPDTPPTHEPSASSWPPVDPGLVWHSVEHPFLPKPAGTTLASLTRAHPDPSRPYVETELVEFDMRFLELGVRGGFMEPKPDTGPPEGGHVPEDPRVFRRIIATMNGGFQSAHGRFGMKSDGRLLVAPSPGLATVTVDGRGRVALGTWTPAQRAEDFVSFRQNLEPLFSGEVFDPSGRGHFGDHLLQGGVFTERSGLCVNRRNNLIFAWSKEIDPKGLAESMQRAGCVYGMHLDMNDGHCSLTFHRVDSFQPLRAESALLSREMKVNANRFLRWSPKDFLYLRVADGTPTASNLDWSKLEKDGGPWGSLLFEAKVPFGPETLSLYRVAPKIGRFAVQPGRGDGGSPAPDVQALFHVGLGHRTHGSRPGLAFGERSLVPMHRGFPTLEITEQGLFQIHEPGVPVSARPATTLVQLPILARDGELSERARARGDTRPRVALCEDTDGALLVALGTYDSFSPHVTTLLEEGCRLVLEADRGSHFAGVARPGAPPRPDPEETLLLVRRGEPAANASWFTSP